MIERKVYDLFVNKFLKLNRPRIAIGLSEFQDDLLKNIKEGLNYAEIVLVSTNTVFSKKSFKCITADNAELKLVSMLVNREVDGIIRGTLDDLKTYEFYQQKTNERNKINPCLVADSSGRQYFLSPVSNAEGWNKEERFKIASNVAELVQKIGLTPKIAIFSGVRHGTYPRKKQIQDGVVGVLNRTYEDAEWIVTQLKQAGFLMSENYSIEFDRAIDNSYNILIPANGMVGNQIFRALLTCGGKVLATPRLGMSHFYEDNSRTEKDFVPHIKWLVAWINSKLKL